MTSERSKPRTTPAAASKETMDVWTSQQLRGFVEDAAEQEAPDSEVLRPADPHVTSEAPDRYDALKALGAGAMGTVELVHDRHLQRRVARKELRRSDAKTRLRFLREARITAQLEHPGIVPVYELGRSESGGVYYTMKEVRGQTLGEALAARGDMTERLGLLGHFIDLCQAVGYAHARGVIHRDLKPDNVMIGPFGETLVLDWGIAAVVGLSESEEEELALASDSALTRAGAVVGTPMYMSPEAAAGRSRDLDGRSDVWSLGVMLLHLISGAPPFQGETAQVLSLVQIGEVPGLDALGAEVPRELAAIVRKALEKLPERRYPDAAALARDLEAWTTGAVVGAYRYGALDQLQRLLWRHRIAAVAATTALLASLAFSAIYIPSLVRERGAALEARALAVEKHLLAEDALADAEAAKRRAQANLGWALLDLPGAVTPTRQTLSTVMEEAVAAGDVLVLRDATRWLATSYAQPNSGAVAVDHLAAMLVNHPDLRPYEHSLLGALVDAYRLSGRPEDAVEACLAILQNPRWAADPELPRYLHAARRYLVADLPRSVVDDTLPAGIAEAYVIEPYPPEALGDLAAALNEASSAFEPGTPWRDANPEVPPPPAPRGSHDVVHVHELWE